MGIMDNQSSVLLGDFMPELADAAWDLCDCNLIIQDGY